MECKREDGSIHAKTNRVKKPKEKEMPGVKEIKDFRGNIISIPVPFVAHYHFALAAELTVYSITFTALWV
jgi:hypothetical protein